MRFCKWLLEELLHWKHLLSEAPLYGLLLLTLVFGLGAYQVRQLQAVDVGGIHDEPYLSAFHAPEPDRQRDPDPEEDYRWTRDRVGIDMLGLGRQSVEVRLRMQAYRPGALSSPEASLWSGGVRLLSTAVGPEWRVYRVVIPPDLMAAGDLHLELRTETFQPMDDPRSLGVSVDWVSVRSAGRGWVGPAWAQVGCLLGVTLLAYLLLRRWGLAQLWSGAVVALLSGLLNYLMAFHRIALTYFTPTLVLLLAWGALLTALILPWLERRGRREGRVGEARLLWVILLLGFLLRVGGMRYPQFRSSDLMLHVHNAQAVGMANLFFTEPLPNVNLAAPYPPGLYVAFLPITLFSDNLPLLMQVFGAALDAVAGVILYLLARRLSRRGDVAVLSLLLMEVALVTYLIFSWGNYTNMFSRTALLGALALLALGRWRYRQARGWLLLAGSFSVILLGHFADSLLFGVFILFALALGLLTLTGRRAGPALLAALLIAGGGALLLYYSAPLPGEALLQGLPLLVRGQGGLGELVNPIPNFLQFVQTPVVLLALPGLALLPRRVWRWPGVVLGGALLAALFFGLAYALYGASTRFDFFILPVLALGAGAMLVALGKRGRVGRLVVGMLLGYLTWNCLRAWWWTIGFGQR